MGESGAVSRYRCWWRVVPSQSYPHAGCLRQGLIDPMRYGHVTGEILKVMCSKSLIEDSQTMKGPGRDVSWASVRDEKIRVHGVV